MDYCSNQNSIPNCVGWSPKEPGSKKWGYTTPVEKLTPQQAFSQWYFGSKTKQTTVVVDAFALQKNP